MRDKIYIAIISAAFLFLLLWCPAMAALEKLGAVTFEDNRNYIDPEKVYEADAPMAELLNKIEEGKVALQNLYTNYLPAYNRIVQTMKGLESSMQMDFVDMLASAPVELKTTPDAVTKTESDESNNNINNNEESDVIPEETEPAMPQFTATYIGEETNRRFYAIRPYDFLDSVMKLDEESLYKNMRHQVEGINRLIKANTDVNFYLYIGKTLQDTDYFNDIIPNELCTASMFNEFMDSIEGAAGKGYFKIDTIEDRLAKQWRTDHHWNAVGSYDVYCDIINMVSKNSPEIGEPVKIKEVIEYPNIQMRGSYAALSGFQNFYEDFFVHVYDFPNPGPRPFSMRSNASDYDAGAYDNNKNMFADHYCNYYVNRKRYVYANETGRNLMIIGDSLTYWSAWLIASNFDATYVYFPWDGETIDYNEYIEENGITDVLMMVYSQAGIFNVYGYCKYEQLRTR